jgi:hypothetical protein
MRENGFIVLVKARWRELDIKTLATCFILTRTIKVHIYKTSFFIEKVQKV